MPCPIYPPNPKRICLNESPRPKAGKYLENLHLVFTPHASMKVPARRRGNENPQKQPQHPRLGKASMKVPARRRGNDHLAQRHGFWVERASMKVPAQRLENKSIPKQPFRHSGIQTLLTSQNITRATRQDYVTCQVLTETDKASKGHYPHLYYQSAIELVIPPLPSRASLANEQPAARE